MSKRPPCGENLISFEEASVRLLKLAKKQKSTLKMKNVLERSNKWRKNGKVEKDILHKLEIARQKRMKLTELLCDTESNPEQSLRARLTDQYYEPIESQIMALTTFHSRTILAQKVFDKITTENVANLVTWLISKPSKHDALRRLNIAFDDMYWKQRINRVRQSSYLYEQIEESSQVDILEFTSQIQQHQDIMLGKSVKVVQCRKAKICVQSTVDVVHDWDTSPMIGNQTLLFNIVNEEEFPAEFWAEFPARRFSEEYRQLPIFIAEITKNNNNGPEVDFSNPIETGYCNGDEIVLLEPFVIKIHQSE